MLPNKHLLFTINHNLNLLSYIIDGNPNNDANSFVLFGLVRNKLEISLFITNIYF